MGQPIPVRFLGSTETTFADQPPSLSKGIPTVAAVGVAEAGQLFRPLGTALSTPVSHCYQAVSMRGRFFRPAATGPGASDLNEADRLPSRAAFWPRRPQLSQTNRVYACVPPRVYAPAECHLEAGVRSYRSHSTRPLREPPLIEKFPPVFVDPPVTADFTAGNPHSGLMGRTVRNPVAEVEDGGQSRRDGQQPYFQIG